jgi:hypothetical protein
MKPKFPIITIYKLQGLEIINDDIALRNVSTLSFLSQSKAEYKIYDSNGKIWTLEFINNLIKTNFITRFLANTFYNPIVKVDLEWEEEGFYNLNELKNDISLCIDKDDDILTQYEEASVIKNAISNSNTFDDILFTLNKYIFDVNEEELWKEQERV